MTDKFNILVDKLNKFRRKFCFYKLIRGILLTLLTSFVAYTLISVIEYFAYLPSLARTFIFYSELVLFILLFILLILSPLFQLLKIAKQTGFEKINKIIVSHFPEIKDKLLNIIELSKIGNDNYSADIIWASIDQKIDNIKLFNFRKAVDFKQLRFIGLYLAVSCSVIIGIIIFDKPVIAESNYRIINYKQDFSKPAPFKFIIQNEELVVNKGDEFTIKLLCEGESFPQVVYINIGENNFLMKKKGNNKFEYKIESVINSFNFYFTDLKYFSDNYFLTTLPKPGISEFNIKIKPPSYTRISEETINNRGDLKVPLGSVLTWKIRCIDTDSLYLWFNEVEKLYAKKNGNWFESIKRIKDDSYYSINISNSYIDFREELSFSISVIPDLYPEISVVQTRDSFQYSRFYFKGNIADDYGFSALNFHLNVGNYDSIVPLQVVYNLINQEFYYTVDFSSYQFSDNEITYYFSVSDNDRVNGPKTTTSGSFIYVVPTMEDIIRQDKEQFAEIEDLMDESRQLANEIKEGLEELQYKNLDSKISDWDKSQLVNEIVNKKNQLENLLDKIKERNQDLNNFVNSFTEQDKEIVEKQAQIEQLLEEIMSDEIKKLMEEFSKLAEEFNEKNFNRLNEQLNMSFDDLSKQLDRNIEILKSMKVEQKLQNVIDRMYKLGSNEESLAQEISESRNYEKVLEEEDVNKKELGDIQESLNDALKINNELKEPLNYDDFDNEFNNLNNLYEENKDNLNNKRRKKSSQSINKTSEEIKSLAFSMDQLLQSNTMEQNMENIDDIRQILSNLIYFSFKQEEILGQLSGIDINDPSLNSIKRNQKNLKDESIVIKDSLYTLANRTPHITSVVNVELLNMEIYLEKSLQELEEGRIPNSRQSQQFIITSVNNLALLLNEALDRLEQMMASNMNGSQNCERPGSGQKKGGNNLNMLKQSSESIRQQLQKMIEEMKKGDSQNMSQMLGQSLMQHEMMQNMLREMINNGNVGSQAGNQLQNIDRLLEETRKELINRSISEKTLMRQNMIRTRLLEAERAEMERDYDNKRESQTADEEFYSNPVKYFEYNKTTGFGTEQFEQSIYKLNNFFNRKYKKYIDIIDGQSP